MKRKVQLEGRSRDVVDLNNFYSLLVIRDNGVVDEISFRSNRDFIPDVIVNESSGRTGTYAYISGGSISISTGKELERYMDALEKAKDAINQAQKLYPEYFFRRF